MSKFNLKAGLLACLIPVGFSMPAKAQAENVEPVQNAERANIESVIRDYILENPEIVVEAFSRFEEQEQLRTETEAQAALQKYRDELFYSDGDYAAGNPDGDVTVVEFFDYNCGWCRRATPVLLDLLESDPDLRVVFKEFPIRGKDSDAVAKASLASIRQGKYFDLHSASMQAEGNMTMERFEDLAKQVGVDIDQLKKDMEDPDIEKVIGRNLALANMLYIEGTPTFLVENTIVRGWPGADGMRDLISAAREAKAGETDAETNPASN